MPNMVTPERLAEIEARAKEASTAPWIPATKENFADNWLVCSLGNSTDDGKDHYVTTDHVHCSEFSGDAKTDAAFIAAARTDIPDLAHTLRELWKQQE